MRRSRLAAMDEEAQRRIVGAVQALAAQAGLDVEAEKLLEISERDPKVQALREREFIAGILEGLVNAPTLDPDHHPSPTGEYVALDELEAVDGVGPALVERIREHFENDNTDDDH